MVPLFSTRIVKVTRSPEATTVLLGTLVTSSSGVWTAGTVTVSSLEVTGIWPCRAEPEAMLVTEPASRSA